MKIPIRMIGVVTTLFWVLLVGFFVSAVYSAKEVRFHFGEPEIGLTADNKTLVSMPITVNNQGYYNIGSFNLSTQISDSEGFKITEGYTFIPVIEKGTEVNLRHNMTVDINDLLQNNQDYLFNDTEFILYEIVGLALAEVIPVQASTNFSVPWGAPLYNFTLGEIDYAAFNESHLTASIPISFVNHAFFDLIGKVQIRLYNRGDALIGSGETAIQAPQDTAYRGNVELAIPVTGVTRNSYCEVWISTETFNFGPLVVSYG